MRWSWVVPAATLCASALANDARVGGIVGGHDKPPAQESDSSKQRLAEGKAALSERPAKRDVARRKFEGALANGRGPVIEAEAYFRLGVLAEAELCFRPALGHYRDSIDAAPSSRWARNSRSRVAWIEQREEGDLAPLAAFERVRNEPALLQDPKAISLLAMEAESFPPGLVRSEARLLVARSWLHSASRREDALAELRRVLSDPSSGFNDSFIAERELVGKLVADERLDDAFAEARSHPFDPNLDITIRRLLRRRLLRRVALAELLAALVLLGGIATARAYGVRPRMALLATLFLGGVSTIAATFVVADAIVSRQLWRFGL